MSYSYIGEYKSKAKSIFLPLISLSNKNGLLKKSTMPFQSKMYLRWEEICGIECMEIIMYFNEEGEIFERFLETTIYTNKNLQSSYDLEDDGKLFVFDISEHWKTVALFIEGKYSKFDNKIKTIIRTFWEDSPINYNVPQLGHDFKIIFHPELYFETAAEELGVSVSLLKKVGELMSPPDIQKEQIKIKLNDTEKIFDKDWGKDN
jgi:hypothetical protein